MILRRLVGKLPRSMRAKVFGLREAAGAPLEFIRDYRRFERFTGSSDNAIARGLSGINLEAQLTKDYHRIEKGLALPEPKRPFGTAVEDRLRLLITETPEIPPRIAANVRSALSGLDQWNGEGAISDELAPPGDSLRGLSAPEEFFMTRHSVRHFSRDQRVNRDTVKRAVGYAQSTPSVCNRRAGRAHFFSDPEEVKAVLTLQRGANGFSASIQDILLITVESGLFTGRGERNQKWIDGGLFAMTLVWTLHSLGVASCMLNWSKTNNLSDQLRRRVDIPESEDIICVIAIGYPAEGYRVARSPKRPLDEILTIHGSSGA